MLSSGGADKEYLPILGLPSFRDASVRFLFGEAIADSLGGRVRAVQALSGTGALRLGALLIHKLSPAATVLVPTPTWPNHGPIFSEAGFPPQQVVEHRYYDEERRAMDVEGILEDLWGAPEGAVVVLHACAHNPTGLDPSPDAWRRILDVVQAKRLLPFFDAAYVGFASGNAEEDAFAVREAARRGMTMLVAQSYAKNMGLYCERVGALHVVTGSTQATEAVLSQLEYAVRAMYSNPPAHGARIAAHILDPGSPLRSEWEAELRQVVARIDATRVELRGALEDAMPGDWSHVTEARGMFSYTGLSPAVCRALVREHHVYLPASGRINVAGLNSAAIRTFAAAVKKAL